MQYILKLTYLDGKDVSIILDDKQIPQFLEAFKKDEPFWQKDAESAFFVPQAQVRYVNILKYVAPPVEVKKEEKIEKMPEVDGSKIKEPKKEEAKPETPKEEVKKG